jgi:hypothetical protein
MSTILILRADRSRLRLSQLSYRVCAKLTVGATTSTRIAKTSFCIDTPYAHQATNLFSFLTNKSRTQSVVKFIERASKRVARQWPSQVHVARCRLQGGLGPMLRPQLRFLRTIPLVLPCKHCPPCLGSPPR